MDLLDGLNPQQKKAVTTTEGPLLVLAGAGSGKTRVLTHRIAYLIKEKGVYPGNILAITFTNKAAGEMKERVLGLLGEENRFLWVSTFHSACVRILRADAEKIGYSRNFVIYDTSDQLVVVKDCLRELDINERDFSPKKVLGIISRAKDNLQSPGEFIAAAEDSFAAERIGWVYRLYQKKLKSNNAMDFDDLILKRWTFSMNTRRCCPFTRTSSATFWWTSTRIPIPPSTGWCSFCPKATGICAWLGTTTSPYTSSGAQTLKIY